MEIKLVEIRDSMTFIPAMAIRLGPRDETERYLLSRAGYGVTPDDQRGYVILCKLNGAQHDPYQWTNQGHTLQVAHDALIKGWGGYVSGDVIDVEFILGETPQPKKSERFTAAF